MAGRYVDRVRSRVGCWNGERGKILSLMAGRYVDKSEDQDWAAGRESVERSRH